ncbi:GDP-mannose 4,6-dehydratase [Candidatus Gottesmanbacteria bacterium]|nr:GDP-mannose 4,6-dehydratase [Candidatus Gottesmanbacteria bacterium]
MANFYKNRKVLITGGLGFIGSNLAIELVKVGAKVTIIDALIPTYGGNLFNIGTVERRVMWVRGDIREKGIVDKVIKDQEILFNLAGTLSHIDSMTDPMTDLEINCRAQLSLLESVRKYNPSIKIVFAGTRNQYGKAKYLPVDEDHPQEPTDINGINNIAAEKYHLMYTSVYGIPTISLRMTNTYGPRHQMRHPRQGVLNWFVRQVLNGEEIILYGGGKQKRDINYVDDVVSALLIIAESVKGWGQAYNLGGQAVSLENFVRLVIKIAGKGSYKKVAFPTDRKAIEIGDYIADYSKMTKTFGWKPRVSLEEGIKKTIDYYEKYKKYYW